MATETIDLRSDTVTTPTPEMRQVMAHADVGDDVFGDDPTVNRLQEKVAKIMGKEAAIYVPSGSMANQTSIRAQTQPGDEIITHPESHIYHYEGGAPAGLSGCSLRFVPGKHGRFNAQGVRDAIRSTDSHFPQTALIVIENTHNRGGGTIWPIEDIAEIREVADEHGLNMHLDGARLMNACVATGHAPCDYAKYFDTVSTCFSKGLGAPVGSAVSGSAEIIARVHRFRKMFGGGMRQAGIIAAGALYALEHHVDRLAEDHANAKRFAEGVDQVQGLKVDMEAVQTNIVYLDVDDEIGTAKSVCERVREQGVWVLPVAPQRVRAVTHLCVSTEQINRAIAEFGEVLSSKSVA